jgi:hypothetical protein
MENIMPLKLNVGLSRKVGQANYGSRGANVNVELELDSTLVQRPDELHGRIRQLFVLARDAVDEELQADARHNAAAPAANGNGHYQAAPPATAAQVRAVQAIAKQQRLSLTELLRQQFGVGRPEDLSKSQASELIDQLKSRGAAAVGAR